LREYQSFENARAYVHSLGLKSQAEWVEYCKSGKRPADIPAKHARRYAKAGWKNWGDWLGTGRIDDQIREYRPLAPYHAFFRSIGLKSWRKYCKSGNKPFDIPTNPQQTYAGRGWKGMGDWLGTATKPRDVPWRTFRNARAYARGLNLKSS